MKVCWTNNFLSQQMGGYMGERLKTGYDLIVENISSEGDKNK